MELIGTHLLGHENVRLYIKRNERGGSFTFTPKDNGPAYIEVGIDYDKFYHCLIVLYHEAFEFILTRLRYRYEQTETIVGSHAHYLFVFNHEEFHHCIHAVSWFINEATPNLQKAFDNKDIIDYMI